MSGNLLAVAIINGILLGGIYGLTAVGLTLIFGVMGVANFAHGAFLMVGMYIAYWLFALLKIDPFIGVFGSMAFLFVMGWFIQKHLINRIMDAPHYNQFVLTLGIMLFLENIALFLWPDYRQLRISYGNAGITLSRGVQINLVRLIVFVLGGGLAIVLYYFLKLTDLGKAIRATSQNKIGAQVVGINIWKIYMLTFAIGSACAGAAGAIISPIYPVTYNIGDLFLTVAFVVVCLGGMGNFIGALIGGLIIGLAESIGTLLIPGGQKQLITYGLFIIILLFKPHGLLRFGGYWEVQ
jgi:branched-chain amino acid transport system permease protein